MAATRAQLLRLMDKLEIPVLSQFRIAIEQIRSRSKIALLTDAIQAGDVEAAMVAAGIRDGQWSAVTEQLRSAYIESGIFSIAADVPKRFGKTFNMSNPRAEEWLRRNSSRFITQMNAEQKDSIQLLLQSGMVDGRNPRSTALDIVGRISPQTGRRAGGVIGLNGPQTQHVINARGQLENFDPLLERKLAPDPAYFNRVRRDKRFDSVVRNAINTGRPLRADEVNKIVGRYQDRLLQTRGETIARTEVLKSLNSATDEALTQVVEDGLAPAEAVTRIWRHSFAGNEREGHLLMTGQERGMGEFFENPITGAMLLHPGAGPASEIINCRCQLASRIDFSAVENAR